MSITLTVLKTGSGKYGNAWAVQGYSADMSGSELFKAAEAGRTHWIDQIIIPPSTAAEILTFQDDDNTLIIGPLVSNTTNTVIITFKNPIALVAGKALHVDVASSGTILVIVEGHTTPSA